MNHVILQPAGNKGARSHYADTIEKPVGLGLIRKHISSDLYEKLSSLYPHGVVPVWGVTPGEGRSAHSIGPIQLRISLASYSFRFVRIPILGFDRCFQMS